jgi:homoserine dehydrogenase
LFSGPGAGGDPTAVSVVSDILDAASWRERAAASAGYAPPPVGGDGADASDLPQLDSVTNGMDRYPFYIRFSVRDQPGIVAQLTETLARHEINVDCVLQEPRAGDSRPPLAMTVEPTPYSKLETALTVLAGLDFNLAPPLALPILRA